MAQVVTKIGPADHGRRMSLDEFDKAQAEEGRIYELSRGIIAVTDVPALRHLCQVDAIRDQLSAFQFARPKRSLYIVGRGHCKIMVAELVSERNLVIEVVSPESERRDYVQTPEEYLRFGVREYWIVDADRREMLALRRTGGRWKEHVIRPPEVYRIGLLRGFEFNCEVVFEAADKAAR